MIQINWWVVQQSHHESHYRLNPRQKWLHEIRIPRSLLGEQLGALVDAEEMLDEAVRLFREVIPDIQEN